MVVHTWGFVQSRPDSPWVKVELRAEPGAVFRVSGLPYAAALSSLARIRSALQSMDVRWPGKALTLHVHPALRAGEINELDVPVALALLAIRKHLGPKAWVQDARVPPDTWTEAAMQLAHTLEKHARMSKRVHHHLRRLAAGHALWEGRERVLTDDVQAAFDVLWMNRSGWWGPP